MSLLELQVPPSPLELAELLSAANKRDHHLAEAALDILRRLMFAYERLAKRENEEKKP